MSGSIILKKKLNVCRRLGMEFVMAYVIQVTLLSSLKHFVLDKLFPKGICVTVTRVNLKWSFCLA